MNEQELDSERKKKHPEPFLCGWTWWSLPPKMWRVAKSLEFENDEDNHRWVPYNTNSGCDDYGSLMAAQDYALEMLRKNIPIVFYCETSLLAVD